MEIRKAGESDTDSIISLLKSSLGEALTPKSVGYWRWKHLENPFGPSPVLLAIESGQVVGVRAFMNWRWQRGDSILRAVRAVDTATHPEYQGKVIFNKLTMTLLAKCAEEGVSLVFNTPNDKSKPGYLKMGWEEAGRLPVTVRLCSPLKVAKNLARRAKFNVPLPEIEGNAELLDHPGLPELLARHRSRLNQNFSTPVSLEYLRWRYVSVPIAKYGFAALGRETMQALVAYRLKGSRAGLEMRITDIILESAEVAREVSRLVLDKASRYGADYVTTSGLSAVRLLGPLGITTNSGPIVTVRRVNDIQLNDLIKFRNWSPTLGDLELF